MSSPWVRMAAVPQTTRPTDAGHSPVSSRWRWQTPSASARPTSHAARVGSVFGSTE